MSNETSCLLSTPSAKLIVDNIAYAGNYWIKPICLILDFIGHIICFVAFYKQFKVSGSLYAFQFYETIARFFDAVGESISLAFLQWWSGANFKGVDWFQRSYGLMWFTAHMVFPLSDVTNTIALFIALAMTVDRAYALGRPTQYKQLNRKLWEGGSIVFSILIGLGASVFVGFYFNVEKESTSDLYVLAPDPYFGSSTIAFVCVHIRNVIWMSGAAALVASSLCMVCFYKSKNQQVATMTNATKDSINEKRKRKAEKTLFLLTIYDSVQTVNEVAILTTHTLLAFKPGFFACEGPLFSAARSLEIAIVNASDFYVLLATSKAFRKMIAQVFSRQQNTSVASSNRQ